MSITATARRAGSLLLATTALAAMAAAQARPTVSYDETKVLEAVAKVTADHLGKYKRGDDLLAWRKAAPSYEDYKKAILDAGGKDAMPAFNVIHAQAKNIIDVKIRFMDDLGDKATTEKFGWMIANTDNFDPWKPGKYGIDISGAASRVIWQDYKDEKSRATAYAMARQSHVVRDQIASWDQSHGWLMPTVFLDMDPAYARKIAAAEHENPAFFTAQLFVGTVTSHNFDTRDVLVDYPNFLIEKNAFKGPSSNSYNYLSEIKVPNSILQAIFSASDYNVTNRPSSSNGNLTPGP